MRREGEVVLVVFSKDDKDGFGHVEGDETEERSSLLVVPGRSCSFAVEVGGAAFPDKVVFVAEIKPLGTIMAGGKKRRDEEELTPKQIRQIGHRKERRRIKQDLGSY
jgi:hypothetical protein